MANELALTALAQMACKTDNALKIDVYLGRVWIEDPVSGIKWNGFYYNWLSATCQASNQRLFKRAQDRS
jgi:hypothetical protein